MADNKKIKVISIGDNAYDVADKEAVYSVNGYSKAAVEAQTVTFANQRIDETEINALFTTEGNN